jgi:hypothetical protein
MRGVCLHAVSAPSLLCGYVQMQMPVQVACFMIRYVYCCITLLRGGGGVQVSVR